MSERAVAAAPPYEWGVPGTVSVIIPAFNAAATLGRTIDSVLAQTRPPIEILVVDDGSTDDTAAVAASFGNSITFIAKSNGGPASARNLAASLAQGEWLAMLDADDTWFPDKIERQLALDVSPQIAIIHSLARHSHGRIPSEVTFKGLWQANCLLNSAVLIRRRVFHAVGGLNEDRALISVEDYNLWLRVAANGWRIVTCQEVLIDYTRGQGLSSHAERFLTASLANANDIGHVLKLSSLQTRVKRRAIIEEFGRSALFERRLSRARSLLRRSLATAPSISVASRLAAAYLPVRALDLRRQAASLMSRHEASHPKHLFGEEVVPAGLSGLGPYLLVVIDTEEEFDWSKTPSRNSDVRSMRRQDLAQRLFDKYRVVPTYAVDYPVAVQYEGYAPLLDFLADGRCEIGAQLHPWLNPPISEVLNASNSFPGNLEPTLEAKKLAVLTQTIETTLRTKPILYRAGRYGLGRQTAVTLRKLGYLVDCSVRPHFDLRPDGGPDYRYAPGDLFWFGPDKGILEIPVTIGLTGALSRFGKRLYPRISTQFGQSARLPGALARTGLLNRIQLTPEGSSLAEAKNLTRTRLTNGGSSVFVLSYHSPSLVPGNTPYVRSGSDLKRFLYWIEAYLDFFFGQLGGVASTPASIVRQAQRLI